MCKQRSDLACILITCCWLLRGTFLKSPRWFKKRNMKRRSRSPDCMFAWWACDVAQRWHLVQNKPAVSFLLPPWPLSCGFYDDDTNDIVKENLLKVPDFFEYKAEGAYISIIWARVRVGGCGQRRTSFTTWPSAGGTTAAGGLSPQLKCKMKLMQ